jgi:serine/threonine protein kinase
MAGSPVYMAPELFEDKEYTDKVDVYAYGVMAYEILTDSLAFAEVKTPNALRAKVLSGGRPSIPSSVPKPWASVMKSTWTMNEADRPSFSEIARMFRDGKLNLPGVDVKVFKQYVDKIASDD